MKSSRKTWLVMLAILGVVIWTSAVAFFHPVMPGPPPGGTTVGRALESEVGKGDSATDRFGDGTPDFLRLDSPEDRDSFRRWFAVIAEYQALRPDKELPPEINDCAALIRYAYRNALHGHDEGWFQEMQMRPPEALPSVGKYGYPRTPLGAALFRVKPGVYAAEDARNGTFAEFGCEDAEEFECIFRFARHPPGEARRLALLLSIGAGLAIPFHDFYWPEPVACGA